MDKATEIKTSWQTKDKRDPNAAVLYSIKNGDRFKLSKVLYSGRPPQFTKNPKTGEIKKVARGIPFVKVTQRNSLIEGK